MPRGSKKLLPARIIRNAIGVTQSQLANRLGIHRVTLERIESGNASVSTEIAERYHAVTGCDLFEGEDLELDILATYRGQPYSHASFESHRDSEEQRQHDNAIISHSLNLIEILLETAQRQGVLEQVFQEVLSFKLATEENHGLVGLADILSTPESDGRILRYASRIKMTNRYVKSWRTYDVPF